MFLKNYTFLLILVSVLAVYGLSYYKRQATYSYWMENRQDYVVENVTAMTTMDAYYWLKMARELDKGTIGIGQVEPTKGYPDLVPLAIKDTPSLLAELISLGKSFTGGDYYRAGLMLIPLLAGLFIFPLFFYFNRLGFGASAVLGGLVGSFSHAYYIRTMMGRLDTDLLNLFFPIAAACLILPMSREKSWWVNLSLAIGVGLTMLLFVRWYQQPSFILLYLVIMVIYLLIGRVISWKLVVLVLPLFLLASGPEYVSQISESVQSFLRAYVSPPPAGLITWPDVLELVTETKFLGIESTLKTLHGFLPLVFAGLTGLAYLCVRHFKQMIPIAPLLLIGAWSLVGPNRFAMYLAPLIGVGAGVMIELLVKNAGAMMHLKPQLAPIVSISLMFTIFFATIGYSNFSYQPQTVISAPTTRALLDIKRIVPKHSAMFTSHWGYGYALMEIGDFATFHDGGLQGGMRTTLISKAMASTRQRDMVALLSYLEDYGFNQLNAKILQEKLSGDEMMKLVFSYPGDFRGKDVYVLYLEDKIRNLGSISYFGSWDFNQNKSDPMGYVELNCSAMVNNIMTCRDGIIDLNRGIMQDDEGSVLFRRALFVNNGYVVDQRDFGHVDGYSLQVLARDNQVKMVLVADERLFRSNFNQQYLLGNYDKRYFEEVYNNFPVVRVLKVKSAKPLAQGTAQ